MARTRNEPAFAARQSEILRAAEALFIRQGFHQTGMAAICAAVGMSPGALYRYFPSKAAIIKAIVAEERADAARLLDRLERATDFRTGVVETLAEAIESFSAEDYRRLALEIAAEAARDTAIARILAESEAELQQRLTRLIAAAQRRGAIDKQITAAAGARLLLMIVDGAMSTGAASERVPPRSLRPVLVRLVEGLFGRGPARA